MKISNRKSEATGVDPGVKLSYQIKKAGVCYHFSLPRSVLVKSNR